MKIKRFILSIGCSVLISTVSTAQVKDVIMTPVNDTLDATSAADTSKHESLKMGYYQCGSIATLVEKVSGSPAGIGLLQVSNHGTENSWFDYSTDTLVISNQAVSKKNWEVDLHQWKYYRVWIRLTAGVAVPKTLGYFVKPDPPAK